EPEPVETYDDIRDVIVNAPCFGGHGYARMDLFPVRHELIAALDPQPQSVFEFGALCGYFLLTAVDAAQSITKAGWVDVEWEPNSNQRCWANLSDYFHRRARDCELWFDTRTNNSKNFGQADLIQVDAAHSYTDCLTDLFWA